MNCELCGDGPDDGDPVVEYAGPRRGWAHIDCAVDAGWEDLEDG